MLGRMFQKPLLDCKRHEENLKERWKLEPQNNSLAYIKYDIDFSGIFIKIIKLDAISQLKRFYSKI